MGSLNDEETQPLSSAPPRRVAEAYKSGAKQNALKKFQCGLMALAFVIILVLASGRDETTQDVHTKKLRSQAEEAPTSAVQKQQEVTKNVGFEGENTAPFTAPDLYSNVGDYTSAYNDDAEAEEELEMDVEAAMEEVDEAEEKEIEINDSMLISAVKSVENSIKFYLGKVFGSDEEEEGEDADDDATSEDSSEDIKLSEEQLNTIAQKISDKLEEEVKNEFRAKADEIAEEKVSEIDQVIVEDRNAGMGAEDIAEDIVEVEKVVEEDLKDEIDEAAKKVRDEIPEKVKKIRNDVVQEVTGKKLDDIIASKRAKAAKQKERLKELKRAKAVADKESVAQKINIENDAKKHNHDKDKDENKSDLVEIVKTVTTTEDNQKDSEPAPGPSAGSNDPLTGEDALSGEKTAAAVDVNATKPESDKDKGTEKKSQVEASDKEVDGEKATTADAEAPKTDEKPTKENMLDKEPAEKKAEEVNVEQEKSAGNKLNNEEAVESARREEKEADVDEE
ncbi:hypothetical protein ACHAW6_014708 [Cyclotella cf. meneghiniana]